MATSHRAQKYREAIAEALVAGGRDDVGVGDVSEVGDGILRVTLSRGSHTHIADIALEKLRDREHTRAAVNAAVLSLSKRVAQEAVKKALIPLDEET